MSSRTPAVAALYAERPTRPFVQASMALALGGGLGVLLFSDVSLRPDHGTTMGEPPALPGELSAVSSP